MHINFSDHQIVNTSHQNNIWKHEPWYCHHILYSVHSLPSVRKSVFFPMFWLSESGLSIRFSVWIICRPAVVTECVYFAFTSNAASLGWCQMQLILTDIKNPNNTSASLNTSHSTQTLQSDMTIHPSHTPTFQIPWGYTKCNIYTLRLSRNALCVMYSL